MNTLSINFLIKDSPTAVAILDTHMRFVSYSRIWLKQFANGHKNLFGQSFYDILPETPEELRKIHKECLKGNFNANKGQKFILNNGRIQWIKWKVNAWKNEDQQVGGLIITQEDITAEKRREDLLRKAKQVARIGGWEVDIVENKVYWTEVTKEIHEVPVDYVPSLEEGINFYKKGFFRNKITQLVTDAMVNGIPWDTELVIVTAKGKELWVRAKGEAELVNGKCVRVYGTFQDIDEKKKIELRYQKISDRLAIATHNANIGIWEYNIPENELIWDDTMYQLYGVKKFDFNGDYEAWEATIHPDDKERCQTEVNNAIEGKNGFDTEFRVIWANGDIRYIKAEATVKRDLANTPLRMVGANWDITEEKKAEKKLKNLLDITSEQNGSLLNFAHIVSHNLRSHSSNLSMLYGFLSKETDEEEKRNLMQMLGNATDSLTETVLHLNEVVGVKTGNHDQLKEVNLFATLKAVKKNLSLLMQEKEAKCSIAVPKTMSLLCIPAYLDSIFLNLFTNSLKYSSPKRKPKITIKSFQEDDQTKIIFSDNGLGIDMDKHRDKLFGMYKTFHDHKDAKGIGLFITKNQMESMNGKIEVDSSVDVGTTFTLIFNKI